MKMHTFMMPPQLEEKMREYMKKTGMKKGEFIRTAIREYLKRVCKDEVEGTD